MIDKPPTVTQQFREDCEEIRVSANARLCTSCGSATGANRGGVLLSIKCRDFKGHSLRYTEQQDSA
jgi:hypothetical protein